MISSYLESPTRYHVSGSLRYEAKSARWPSMAWPSVKHKVRLSRMSSTTTGRGFIWARWCIRKKMK